MPVDVEVSLASFLAAPGVVMVVVATATGVVGSLEGDILRQSQSIQCRRLAYLQMQFLERGY